MALKPGDNPAGNVPIPERVVDLGTHTYTTPQLLSDNSALPLDK